MTRLWPCLLAVVLAWSAVTAHATDTPAKIAETAAADLRAAVADLNRAKSGKDRVAALTVTIQAYEAGMGALRQALRDVFLREAEMTADLDRQYARTGRILAALSSLEKTPVPAQLLHPDGALGTARSAMILAGVTPALQAEAVALRLELVELQTLRAAQDVAGDTLQAGLAAAQSARTALSLAMQDRTDLPKRFLEDPEELKALVASAGTLDGFAEGILTMETDIGAPIDDFAALRGKLPLPVRGTLRHSAGAADAAGIRRPGMVIATAARALVTAPVAATIRYRGPLLDYGNVMILEPATGYLLVIAGIAEVYGDTGDILAKGAPIGLMGGIKPGVEDITLDAQQGGSVTQAETLYIELRQGTTPVDPDAWFIETRED